VDFTFHQAEFQRLEQVLTEAASSSHLPEEPTARETLNSLLLRIRRI
jgi:hypothetical protein